MPLNLVGLQISSSSWATFLQFLIVSLLHFFMYVRYMGEKLETLFSSTHIGPTLGKFLGPKRVK